MPISTCTLHIAANPLSCGDISRGCWSSQKHISTFQGWRDLEVWRYFKYIVVHVYMAGIHLEGGKPGDSPWTATSPLKISNYHILSFLSCIKPCMVLSFHVPLQCTHVLILGWPNSTVAPYSLRRTGIYEEMLVMVYIHIPLFLAVVAPQCEGRQQPENYAELQIHCTSSTLLDASSGHLLRWAFEQMFEQESGWRSKKKSSEQSIQYLKIMW